MAATVENCSMLQDSVLTHATVCAAGDLLMAFSSMLICSRYRRRVSQPALDIKQRADAPAASPCWLLETLHRGFARPTEKQHVLFGPGYNNRGRNSFKRFFFGGGVLIMP